MEITAAMFEAAVGVAPEQDDLERCNCKRAGDIGHSMCGWCSTMNRPVFMCQGHSENGHLRATPVR